MKHWTIKVFITPRGEDVIEGWLIGIPPKARAKIDRFVRYLEIEESWKRPYFDKLTGYKNLYEIRIVHNNNQYRLIGCFGPRDREFTILVGAIERDGNYDPYKALRIAEQRSKLILQGERYTDEY